MMVQNSTDFVSKVNIQDDHIQTNIPSDIAKQLNIKAGDNIIFSTGDSGVVTIKKEAKKIMNF